MAKEISLKELFKVIKKRLWVILLTTILVGLAGYLYTTFFKSTPLYQSETRVVIGANASDMSTLVVMIKDPTVLNKVSKNLNGKRSPGALANEITAQSVDSSQVVSITVVDQNPRLAAVIANTTARIFKNEAANVLNFKNVQLLSQAKVYPQPINPVNHHKTIYGLVAGLILGVGLAFLLNAVDDTIQAECDLEKLLKTPVLGSIAKMNKKNMYRNRRVRKMRKDSAESPNVLKMGAKQGKWPFKKPESSHQSHDLAHKSSESVQRVHH